jgi:hypothetical protein
MISSLSTISSSASSFQLLQPPSASNLHSLTSIFQTLSLLSFKMKSFSVAAAAAVLATSVSASRFHINNW